MFKKTKLAAAVMAATAINAQAAVLSDDGTGEVLIYPYYNVNNSFQTNVHITNTTSQFKIVKVRFRESGASQDVLDFNLYMSPYDVWTGAVQKKGDDTVLVSADKSCTIPMHDKPLPGTDEQLGTTGWKFKTDVGVTQDDLSEGYIEVLEAGVIPDTLYVDTDGNGTIDDSKDSKLQNAIKHSGGTPANCQLVEDAWLKYGVGSNTDTAHRFGVNASKPSSSSSTDHNAMADITGPTGGLYGFGIYLDVLEGGAYVAEATAIKGWSNTGQHYLPSEADDFGLPSLASGEILVSQVNSTNTHDAIVTTWPLTIDATLNDQNSKTPRSSDTNVIAGAAPYIANPMPVAHVLAVNSVMNDYFIDPNLEGATDWVVTFPMKKHGVIAGTKFSNNLNLDTITGSVNTDSSDVGFTGMDKVVRYKVSAYDREESSASTGITTSPVTTGPARLAREVNVITIASNVGNDDVLGSPNRVSIDTNTDFTEGWMNLTFDDSGAYQLCQEALAPAAATVTGDNVNFMGGTIAASSALIGPSNTTAGALNADLLNTSSQVCFQGVPAIGFAAIRGKNAVNSSYGETVRHSTDVLLDITGTVNPL